MRKPSTVLLDLDGTLIESKPGIVASYWAMLRDLGHEPDTAIDLDFVIGPVITDVIGEVLAPYGDTRVDQAVAAYRRHYGASGIYDVKLYDGIEALLASLDAAGSAMYLATSKRTTFAVPILEHLGLTHYFTGVYGSEPDGFRDHKPELIAHIMRRHHLQAEETVMVGDRRYDIAGAHAHGLRAIGVVWGYGSRAEFDQAGADLVIETPAELAKVLTGRVGAD